MLSNLALSNPVSPVTLPSLISRGEINPIWEKFGTKADEDMPGYPEWFVLAKHNLSSWDDVNWALSSTEPMHGMYSSYRGMANGCVYFSLCTSNLTASSGLSSILDNN
jgi:hypothetical protein